MLVAILALTAANGVTLAGEIYKSVDANGNVVYSDHIESTASPAVAVQLEDPRYPPHELHFCWTNCFTLVLDAGVYRRTDGTDETWSIQTFTAKAIVLHRHSAPADWNGNNPDVVYAGKVANDRLVGVTVDGRPTSGIDAAWGVALNTLPGSNTERDTPTAANPAAPAADTVSASATPPPLPAEQQPVVPQDGYLWTPGYWYWRDRGYFWVPGAWVRPPQFGVLWTPAYWSHAGTVYVFHPGYWGSSVGFYGGLNYGYGYFGTGYSGGHWVGNSFAYNNAVNNINPAVVHHSYAGPAPTSTSNSLAIHPTTQHQSAPRAASNQATPGNPAPASAVRPATPQAAKPASVVRTPVPRATPHLNHPTSLRTPPARQ